MLIEGKSNLYVSLAIVISFVVANTSLGSIVELYSSIIRPNARVLFVPFLLYKISA